MPRACASCSITALRSGSAPALASTFTSWRLRCCPAFGPASRWSCSRAPGRTGWTRRSLPGARSSTCAFPSGSSTLPGIGWSGRPWNGSPERWTSPTRPTPCCCRAGTRVVKVVTVYDLDFLDHPGRTRAEIRRDYPALAARHAQRADLVVVISEHTAREVRSRLGVAADRIVLCRPGAPPAVGRSATGSAGTDPVRRHDRAAQEPADALCRLRAAGRAQPRRPAADPGGRRRRALGGDSRRPARARGACRPGRVPRLRQRCRASGALRVRVDAGAALVPRRLRTAGRRSDAGRRAGDRLDGAAPCRRWSGTAGITVDPADAAGFSAAMERLLADPDERRRRAEAGREQARLFSWTASAAALLDAYREAFARRTAR